ncbi:MAG: hypothetical protein JWL97_4515 [Gemmatimonadales bacterium]|nr:hypothetical protein [Gemmatimonadales bacterium]
MTAISMRTAPAFARQPVRSQLETMAIRFTAGEVGPLRVIWRLLRLRNGLSLRQRRATFTDLCRALEEHEVAERGTPDWGQIEADLRDPDAYAQRCLDAVDQELDALTGVRR